MKRRNFVKSGAALGAVGLPLSQMAQSTTSAEDQTEWYEIREYQFGWSTAAFEDHLKQHLIPAMNRAGVRAVGAFKLLHAPEPARMYVLSVFPTLDVYTNLPNTLAADATYQKDGADFIQLEYHAAPYVRYTTSLLQAFSGIPQMRIPKQEERIFELRTYEGHNLDAVRRKIKMFNVEELPLFDEVGLHSVFFGNVWAGPSMPALTYLLHFKDMAERDANWQKFLKHPDWNRMKALPEYVNTVSRIQRYFLVPTDYSQV